MLWWVSHQNPYQIDHVLMVFWANDGGGANCAGENSGYFCYNLTLNFLTETLTDQRDADDDHV